MERHEKTREVLVKVLDIHKEHVEDLKKMVNHLVADEKNLTFKYTDKTVEDVSVGVEDIIQQVTTYVSDNDPCFKSDFECKGSFYEKCRVSANPDEFDFMALLNVEPSHVRLEVNNSATVTEIRVDKRRVMYNCEEMSSMCVSGQNNNVVLDPSKLFGRFAALVDLAMENVILPNNFKHGGFSSPKYSGWRKHGPALMFQLEYNSPDGKHIPLTVDLTIGVRCRLLDNEMPATSLIPFCHDISELGLNIPISLCPLKSGQWAFNVPGIEKQILDQCKWKRQYYRLLKLVAKKYMSYPPPQNTYSGTLTRESLQSYDVSDPRHPKGAPGEQEEEKCPISSHAIKSLVFYLARLLQHSPGGSNNGAPSSEELDLPTIAALIRTSVEMLCDMPCVDWKCGQGRDEVQKLLHDQLHDTQRLDWNALLQSIVNTRHEHETRDRLKVARLSFEESRDSFFQDGQEKGEVHESTTPPGEYPWAVTQPRFPRRQVVLQSDRMCLRRLESSSGNDSNNTRIIHIGAPVVDSRSLAERTLLVVGPPTQGKSKAVLGMLNHLHGVQWADDFRYIIPEILHEYELLKTRQTQRATEKLTVYKIYSPEGASCAPFVLNVIDTPGYSRGQDDRYGDQLLNNICSLFPSHDDNGNLVDETTPLFDHLDAICLVKSTSRKNHVEGLDKHVCETLLGRFQQHTLKLNIFVLITTSSSCAPGIIDELQRAEVPFEHAFTLNNEVLYASNDVDDGLSKVYWEMHMASYQRMFDIINAARTTTIDSASTCTTPTRPVTDCPTEDHCPQRSLSSISSTSYSTVPPTPTSTTALIPPTPLPPLSASSAATSYLQRATAPSLERLINYERVVGAPGSEERIVSLQDYQRIAPKHRARRHRPGCVII